MPNKVYPPLQEQQPPTLIPSAPENHEPSQPYYSGQPTPQINRSQSPELEMEVTSHPTAVVVIPNVLNMGPEPMRIECPHCHATITTNLKTSPTTKTHLFAVLLCLLCWPCVFIPYTVESCQGKKHFCPNCTAYLGTYSD